MFMTSRMHLEKPMEAAMLTFVLKPAHTRGGSLNGMEPDTALLSALRCTSICVSVEHAVFDVRM